MPTYYQAENATIVGDVTLGQDSSAWYGAVIRADSAPIVVGPRSNVQDNATIHVDPGFPVHIGKGVTIGHNAVVHGCVVGGNTVIGMGAIVLNGAKIGRDCIIGAGALVTQGTVIPDGSIAFGNPAKVRKQMSEEAMASNRLNATDYVEHAQSQLPAHQVD